MYGETRYESYSEAILTPLRGAKADMTAADVHGNEIRQEVHSVGSAFSEVAAELASRGIGGSGAAFALGGVSGVSHGLGDFATGVYTVVTEHYRLISKLVEFVETLAAEPELVAAMAKPIPVAVHNRQARDNPWDEPYEGGDAGHMWNDLTNDGEEFDVELVERAQAGELGEREAYAVGFYSGYSVWFALETIATGRAVSWAGDVAAIESRLDTVQSTVRSGVSVSDAGPKTAAFQAEMRTLRPWFNDLARSQRTDTSGGIARTVQQRLDDDLIAQLGTDSRLTDFLSHHGEFGVRLLEQADDVGTAQRLLSLEPGTVYMVDRFGTRFSTKTDVLERTARLSASERHQFEFQYAAYGVRHGEDGLDHLDALRRIDGSTADDVRGLLNAPSSTVSDLNGLSRADRDLVLETYAARDSSSLIQLGANDRVGPLVTMAKRGELQDASFVVVSDRIHTTAQYLQTGIHVTETTLNAVTPQVLKDRSTHFPSLVYDAVTAGYPPVEGDDERVIVADTDGLDLEGEDLDEDVLIITIDDDGSITDVTLANEHPEENA